MLKLEHLTAAYPDGTKPVQDVSLCVEDGQRVALIGANGAGKTSLILSLVGVLPADGAVTVDGLTLCPENLPALRRKIGVVFQDPDDQLFMPTVLEDVAFGLENQGLPVERARQKAQAALDALNIGALAGRTPLKLSGGEKRMAAIATILAMQPKIMLMDEPSTALDPKNRRTLIRTLNALPVTKIIATHDLDLVLETCDRVLLLHDGQIAADGPAWEILRDRALLERHSLELPFCLAGVPERAKKS